jgi:hypothetical protein
VVSGGLVGCIRALEPWMSVPSHSDGSEGRAGRDLRFISNGHPSVGSLETEFRFSFLSEPNSSLGSVHFFLCHQMVSFEEDCIQCFDLRTLNFRTAGVFDCEIRANPVHLRSGGPPRSGGSASRRKSAVEKTDYSH